MADVALDIWNGTDLVGRLSTVEGALALTYEDAWVANPRAVPISLSMPLDQPSYRGDAVSNALWGLLPDDPRVVALWASSAGCAPDDLIGLLGLVGGDVAGAMRYLPEGTDPGDGTSGDIEFLDDHGVAQILRGLRSDDTSWHVLDNTHWSLGGKSPKVALAWDERTQRWGVPHGGLPTTHIFCPGPLDATGAAASDLNEHLGLSVAASLGIAAPRSQICWFDGIRTLVVERYDRISPEGALLRVHQEDLGQAHGVHPSRRRQSDGGPSVVDTVAMLRAVDIGRVEAEIDALLRVIAFGWVILAMERDARSTSLLLSARHVRLAPAYALRSVAPISGRLRKARLAQEIGGEHRVALVGAKHWRRLATAVGRDPDALVATVADVAERVPDLYRTAVMATSLEAHDVGAAMELADDVAFWAEACAGALGAGHDR